MLHAKQEGEAALRQQLEEMSRKHAEQEVALQCLRDGGAAAAPSTDPVKTEVADATAGAVARSDGQREGGSGVAQRRTPCSPSGVDVRDETSGGEGRLCSLKEEGRAGGRYAP